jgi:hypothetical protein
MSTPEERPNPDDALARAHAARAKTAEQAISSTLTNE